VSGPNEVPFDLIEAYLDGSLSPSDQDALLTWLNLNSENVREFLRAVHDHQMLRQTLVAEAVLRLSDDKPARHGTAPHRRRLAAGEEIKKFPASSVHFQCMALAASLAFLVVTVFYLFSESKVEERSVAALIELRAGVEIERNQEVFPAKTGDALQEGDLVRTGPDAAAVVIYPDFSRSELAADSEVTFRSGLERTMGVAPSAKHLWFHRGSLLADMAKQPVGRPVEFQMPNATVTVRGTVLGISAAEDKTSVAVSEGAVALHRYTDGKEELVSAGGKAEALGAAFNPNYGRLVFLRNFDSVPEGETVVGDLVRLPSPDGEVTAVAGRSKLGKAVDNDPLNLNAAGWHSDHDILWYGGAHAATIRNRQSLYAIPENVEIRMRLKAERAGTWYFTQAPLNTSFENEHFLSSMHSCDAEWREYVFHAGNIKPYRRALEGNTRDFLPGVPIGHFSIRSSGAGKVFVDRFEVIALSGARR